VVSEFKISNQFNILKQESRKGKRAYDTIQGSLQHDKRVYRLSWTEKLSVVRLIYAHVGP